MTKTVEFDLPVLLDGNVDDILAKTADMPTAVLEQLLELEKGGKTRSTLMGPVEAELAKRVEDGDKPADLTGTAAGVTDDKLRAVAEGDPSAPNEHLAQIAPDHLAGYIEQLGAPTTLEDAILERNAWVESAATFSRNEGYYRGLLEQIGETLGGEAYICDDKSLSEDVLCAKLPQIVAERLARSEPDPEAEAQADPAAQAPAMYSQADVDRIVAEKEAEWRASAKTPKQAAKAKPAKPLAIADDTGADAALAALKGGSSIVLVDSEDVPIAGLTPLTTLPQSFDKAGGELIYTAAIEIPTHIAGAELAGAFLLDAAGEPVARASLVAAFGVGGGRETKLPPRTLSFARPARDTAAQALGLAAA
jgi:pyruvate/2-oxoglutarate dehydrogenase complex dihydrolipoamide acyltransferase (E2) component